MKKRFPGIPLFCMSLLFSMSVQPACAGESLWYLKQQSEHIGSIDIYLGIDCVKVACKDAGNDFFFFPKLNQVFVTNNKRGLIFSRALKNWHPELTNRMIFALDLGLNNGPWMHGPLRKEFGLNVFNLSPASGKKVDQLLVTDDIKLPAEISREIWELYASTTTTKSMPREYFPLEFTKAKSGKKLRKIFYTIECKRIAVPVKLFAVPKLKPVKKELDVYLAPDTLNNLLDTAGIGHD